jgi:hypothetical protein
MNCSLQLISIIALLRFKNIEASTIDKFKPANGVLEKVERLEHFEQNFDKIRKALCPLSFFCSDPPSFMVLIGLQL